MGRINYSTEFATKVVEHYKSNSAAKTAQKFSIPQHHVVTLAKRVGFHKTCVKYPLSFKHEVCQYYDNHTCDETAEKFGIMKPTLFLWRRTLGYRNKSRGYNLYMQDMQPVVQTQQRRDFMVTRDENGKLRADLAEITQKYVQLEQEFTQFKSKIMEALQ